MTIYIEYAVLDNMVIDLLILNLTKRILKLQNKKIYLFLSALLGTAAALLSPLLPTVWNFILKFVLAFCMVLIAYPTKSFRQYVVRLSVFLLITFLFGGTCIALFSLFGINIMSGTNLAYSMEVPLGAILLLLLLLYVLCKNLFQHFYHKKNIASFTYDVQLYSNGNSISAKAFLDSGNNLSDSTNGSPVILINYDLFSKLYPEIPIENLLLKKIENLPLKNPHYLNAYSVGNRPTKLLVFTVDEIKIFFQKNVNIHNINVGLALNYQKQFSCDCIIGPNCLVEES